ncbi:uncharacterized protein LOC133859671 isoform X2 [Alnus glutinosa]|uniref:uncharacterized protein LOC133859671 isoform X2 n=1 Tax=Alnus glutinosa TaxID=3517 RepID=UPI002D77E449|nr:uncharacterized protein LOC133859671 isoform X2 [Alnus glutinosa]
MKTILIICILFASLLFSPSSILARELAESTGGNGQTGNPNKPAIKECGPPESPAYSKCIAKSKQKPKCNPKDPYTRCTGTGTSGTPNNPAVKPGIGSSGNPNNPAVKPGTGQPIFNDRPKGPITKPNPKHKCDPSTTYGRCPPQDP